MALVLLIGRVLVGYYFLSNAYNHLAHSSGLSGYAASKRVPSPKAAVIVSGLLLLGGGLSILLGVAVAWGLTCLLVFMIPVTFMMHNYWKDSDPAAKSAERIAFMKNLAIIGLILMLYYVSAGPWPYSLG